MFFPSSLSVSLPPSPTRSSVEYKTSCVYWRKTKHLQYSSSPVFFLSSILPWKAYCILEDPILYHMRYLTEQFYFEYLSLIGETYPFLAQPVDMADDSPPPSDAVPELTPDNGSLSTSSSNYSFNNRWEHQWGAQAADWEANNELYIPGQINFLRDPEEVHDEDMPPSPPSPVVGINDATRTPLLERLARRMFPWQLRSRGSARPSSRSSPRTVPDRGFWDSPHVVAIPGFQDANHRPEEDERQDLHREEQGPAGPDQLRPRLPQNPPATITPVTPIDSIPPLDLGSPVVSRSAPSPDVAPPRVPTTRSLGNRVSAAWRCVASAGRRLAIRRQRESGVPAGSDMPYRPAGDAPPAPPTRFRGFWSGLWRGLQGGRGRGREPGNGLRGSGRRRLFSSRRHTV